MIKASEYDKVDVFKQLAESEGKQKFLTSENERMTKAGQELEIKVMQLEKAL